MLIDFRERRGRERNMDARAKQPLVASHVCLDWDWTCNLGMCSDKESNPKPSSSQTIQQPTEPHAQGWNLNISLKTHLKISTALAGMAQLIWVLDWTGEQRVAGSIPSPGTCLGCGPHPQWGLLHKRQPHIDVSLPLSPSLPFFLKWNKTLKKKSLQWAFLL